MFPRSGGLEYTLTRREHVMKRRINILVVVLVLAISGTLWAESASVLFEKGLYNEETVGDLDAAIAVYKQIIDDAQANRRYVAQAHYRLGMCHLKKGNKDEAAKCFQQLTSHFSDQTETARQAQQQLDKIYPAVQAQLPGEVIAYIIAQHKEAYKRAQAKGLFINTHVIGVDNQFNKHFGGIMTVKKYSNRIVNGEMRIGGFSSPPNFILTDEMGRSQQYRVEKLETTAIGKYKVWWKPDKPLQPGEVRLLGYRNRKVQQLPKIQDGHLLKMNNHFGEPVLENFFVVIPYNVAIVKQSSEPVSSKRIGIFKILLWQKEVPPGTTNKVDVVLAAGLESAPLELGPAPWLDGEEMQLDLKLRTGMQLGTIIYSAELIKSKDKDAWRIQSYMTIPMQNLRQFTSVDAERESFAPITGRTKGMMGDFKARYQPNKVLLDVERKGKKTSQQTDIEGIAYDNEQALYLIRRLPLKEGYEAAFPIFSVQSGAVMQCRIKVAGKEKIKRNEQEIETYKVSLSIHSQGVKAFEHQLWFSTDASRLLVRYDSGTAIMELVKSGVKQKNKAKVFQDRELGISVSVPADWYYYNDPAPGRYKFMLHLLPPEMKAWSLLAADAGAASLTSARKVAEMDIEILKGYFKNYKVRPKTWTNLKVSNLPAVSYAADYQDKGTDMVEYRSYLLGKSMVYWFVFRIEKDEFEANKAEFDSIITTLKAGKEPGKKISQQAKRKAENLAAEGWRLWRARKLVEAENKFKQAVARDPNNANAWNGLGWAQQNQGKPLNAKTSFEKCLAIEPKHAAALNGLGWIAKSQGKTQEAIGYWEKAIDAVPTATAALAGLARTHAELGQNEKAMEYYQIWLKAEPTNKKAKEGLEKAKAAVTR